MIFQESNVGSSIVVNRKLDDVWGVFTDINLWEKWWAKASEVTPEWGQGAFISWGPDKGKSEIITFLPKKVIIIKGFNFDTRFSFSESGNQTIFSITDGQLKFGSWTDGGAAEKKSLEQVTNSFKVLVESMPKEQQSGNWFKRLWKNNG